MRLATATSHHALFIANGAGALTDSSERSAWHGRSKARGQAKSCARVFSSDTPQASAAVIRENHPRSPPL